VRPSVAEGPSCPPLPAPTCVTVITAQASEEEESKMANSGRIAHLTGATRGIEGWVCRVWIPAKYKTWSSEASGRISR
jgi:hypothetical protein